jgi:D-tyrosyl-tRNA(Tyr) deacylase
MRALVQRVSRASVTVEGRVVASIGPGLLALVGIARDDGEADSAFLVRKIVQLRIFDDDHGVMNRSLAEVGGELLAVSQFTLYASTAKGNRPSYIDAAPPEIARPRFEAVLAALSQALGRPVPSGVFGADMKVALVNEGPVTIWLDSRGRPAAAQAR